MALQLPPLPPQFAADAKDAARWQAEVVAYAKASGLPNIRCARRIDGAGDGGVKNYYQVDVGSVRHHLRTVLPTQVVFDLGDLVPGDPPEGDWGRCRMESDAIASACTNLGVPFIMSLSGGKGIHHEIYLPPEGPQSRCRDEGEDWRIFIANAIVAEAKRILWPDPDERVSRHIVYDRLCISPREGNRLLTECGERKTAGSPHRKVVWHSGFGPAPPLPDTREEAYAIAEKRGIVRPSSIPIADCERLDSRWVAELNGGPCPQGPACFDNERWGCENCPALD